MSVKGKLKKMAKKSGWEGQHSIDKNNRDNQKYLREKNPDPWWVKGKKNK